jgi:hypothetical protein
MIWITQRYSDNSNSTQGMFFEKDEEKKKVKFFSHTLEDEFREVKVSGETRIPAGFYELKIRKEETVLTIKHREKYGEWFKFHIEITGIKNFSRVYIHALNHENETDGCLGLGDSIGNNTIEPDNMTRSLQAIKRFYEKVYPHLDSGKRAFIEFRDEDKLYQ